MAVAFDAQGSSVATANSPSSPFTSTNMTVGASATCLIVLVNVGTTSTSGTLIAVTGVTWNGVSMTLIGSKAESDGTAVTSAYGLCSPASGNQTISVSFSGGTPADCGIYVDAVSFTGSSTTFSVCFPSANVVTDATNATNASTYPDSPLVVTTANGDAAVAVSNSSQNSYSAATPTLINSSFAVVSNYISAYGLASGTSVSLQFTSGVGNNGAPCCAVAFRVAQPPAGPPLSLMPKLLINM